MGIVCVCVYLYVCIRTKVSMISYSGLVVSIKPKAKENLHKDIIFLVYIPQKYYQKKVDFRECLLPLVS
jgi:hypothetical protein